jgi:hypothetical protein
MASVPAGVSGGEDDAHPAAASIAALSNNTVNRLHELRIILLRRTQITPASSVPGTRKRLASEIRPSPCNVEGIERALADPVPIVSVEVCGVLFPANVTLGFEKLHVAYAGRPEQARVAVPT